MRRSPGFCIGAKKRLETWLTECGVPLHDGLYGPPDRGETTAALEKGGHGDLVGGVEHRREGAAGFASPAGEAERGKVGGARGLKLQLG